MRLRCFRHPGWRLNEHRASRARKNLGKIGRTQGWWRRRFRLRLLISQLLRAVGNFSNLALVLIAASWMASCTVGPNYHRPAVQIPQTFRAPEPLPAPQAASLADLKWFEVFKDEKLQELIRAALAQNYDLRDAVARVEEARANLGITRSNQFPQVGRQRQP